MLEEYDIIKDDGQIKSIKNKETNLLYKYRILFFKELSEYDVNKLI